MLKPRCGATTRPRTTLHCVRTSMRFGKPWIAIRPSSCCIPCMASATALGLTMPFKPRLNLRSRFILALLVVATLLSGGYYYAVHEFIEVLEDELGTQSLIRELNAFTEYYAKNPAAQPI